MSNVVTVRADKIEIGLASSSADIVRLVISDENKRVEIFVPNETYTQLLNVVVFAALANADSSLASKPGNLSLSSIMPTSGLVSFSANTAGVPNGHGAIEIDFCGAKLAFSAPLDAWSYAFTRIFSRPEPQARKFPMTIGADGVWQTNDPNESAIIKTLQTASDRAVAIIGATLIEARLQKTILERTLHNDYSVSAMFGVAKPLGSFMPKIELCYMMGIISEEAHLDLKDIAWIRNRFAHSLDIQDFNSEQVAVRANRLRLVETHIGLSTGAKGEMVCTFERNARPRINVHDYHTRKVDPRQRYLMAVQLFTFAAATSNPALPMPFI